MEENKHTEKPDFFIEKRGREIITDRDFQGKRLWYFMLNSIIIFILTYFIIYCISEAITFFIAKTLDIPATFYYFEIVYPANFKWDFVKTLSVSTIGPVVVFIIGMVCFDNFIRIKGKSPYFKMFFGWLAFQGITFFMGALIAGSYTGIGLGYSIDIILFPNIFMGIFFALAGIAGLIYLGNLSIEFFLTTSPSLYWLLIKNHLTYLAMTMLVPYLLGTVIIYMIKYPNHVPQRPDQVTYDLIQSLSMIFLIVPILFKRFAFDFSSRVAAKERTRTLHFQLLIIMIVLVVLFRILFS